MWITILIITHYSVFSNTAAGFSNLINQMKLKQIQSGDIWSNYRKVKCCILILNYNSFSSFKRNFGKENRGKNQTAHM